MMGSRIVVSLALVVLVVAATFAVPLRCHGPYCLPQTMYNPNRMQRYPHVLGMGNPYTRGSLSGFNSQTPRQRLLGNPQYMASPYDAMEDPTGRGFLTALGVGLLTSVIYDQFVKGYVEDLF